MQYNGVEFFCIKKRGYIYITFLGEYKYYQDDKIGYINKENPRVVVTVKRKDHTRNYKLNYVSTPGFENINIIYKNEQKLTDLLTGKNDKAFLEEFANVLKEIK